MDSHPKIAQEILRIFNESGLSVPVKDVENMVEIKSRLTSIANGNLVVDNKPEVVPDASGNGDDSGG